MICVSEIGGARVKVVFSYLYSLVSKDQLTWEVPESVAHGRIRDGRSRKFSQRLSPTHTVLSSSRADMLPQTLQPSTPDLQQAILYTLLDVFDAARDLYQTLAIKERRDNARAKGYVSSRNVELVDDAEDNGTRGILTDKLAVLKRYEDGLRVVGEEVAIGDGELILFTAILEDRGKS